MYNPFLICMCSLLSQYQFCVGGVGLGAAYAIKKSKGPMPMMMAGVAGTFADLVYGYVVACSKQVETYNDPDKST